MAVHHRAALKTLLDNIERQEHRQVYLLYGERYLCQEAAQLIASAFLKKPGALHRFDGTTLSASQLCARVLSHSILPGWQIYRVTDCRLFHSKNSGEELWKNAEKAFRDNKPEQALRQLSALLALASLSQKTTNVFADMTPDSWQKGFGFAHPNTALTWADQLISSAPVAPPATKSSGETEKLIKAISTGLPMATILLLIAETVDKRKKLFTQIKKHGEIIDCSVAAGATRGAQKQQQQVCRELAQQVLQRYEKSAAKKVLEALYERIGCHPVAVVMEVEKLCLYAEQQPQITMAHLNTLVSRTREDALYELTDAIGSAALPQALKLLDSLLRNGTHSLAIIASLRNYFRKFLIIRALQQKEAPRWSPTLNAQLFQNQYLPALKEQNVWPELLSAHPYALFVSFTKAARYPPAELKAILRMILDTEFKLKSSVIAPQLILEALTMAIIGTTPFPSR